VYEIDETLTISSLCHHQSPRILCHDVPFSASDCK